MESAHDGHQIWEDFSSEIRQELIEEDRVAWRGVCTVLLAIIAFGLVLGVTAVLICLSVSSGI